MKKVLVFDDDIHIREMLTLLLASCGYEVFSFEDPSDWPQYAEETCRCNGHTCCDIIISDINMPRVNGLELVRRQQQKGCSVRHIALMSGCWSDSDIEQASTMGCRVLKKPFFLNEMRQWLAACEEYTAGKSEPATGAHMALSGERDPGKKPEATFDIKRRPDGVMHECPKLLKEQQLYVCEPGRLRL